MSTAHKETKTITSPDGTTTTTTTTTTTSRSSGGGSGGGDFNFKSLKKFFGGEDPFSEDFFKKFIEESLPSHGQIKKVHYQKDEEKQSDLPEDFNLFVKPTEKFDYQVSDCTGRKKAVLVGINYFGTDFQLRGSYFSRRNFDSR
jgi:hypothetical protein